MTSDKMTFEKMTFNKMTFDKMTKRICHMTNGQKFN